MQSDDALEQRTGHRSGRHASRFRCGSGGVALAGAVTFLALAACQDRDITALSDLGAAGVGGVAAGGMGGADDQTGSGIQFISGPARPPAAPESSVSAALGTARVLQQAGDRLYLYSSYDGLTIVDLTNPAALTVAGRYVATAEPFALQVEGEVVFALLNDSYTYDCVQGATRCAWRASGRLQVLDARDPAHVQLLGEAVIPGDIVGAHRSGNLLYVVASQEDCWRCISERNYTVTSFDLLDPANPIELDQLPLLVAEDAPRGKPTVAVGAQRLYIAASEVAPLQPAPLHVVDLSDPGGALQSTRLELAGGVQSPAHLLERAGTLQVFSQPRGLGGVVPAPVLQTFRIPAVIEPELASSISLQVPEGNWLRSVHTEGARAYVGLQTQVVGLDLSDPEQPRQLGTLDLSGAVYGVEARGDRLIVLADDPDSLQRRLQLSLFDVTDLEQPSLLARAALGSADGSFPVDRDAQDGNLTVLSDGRLLAVPFDGAAECSGSGGVRLVDADASNLLPRGIVPQLVDPQLLAVHREHLLAASNQAIQSFSLVDRDAPVAAGRVDSARAVSGVRLLGEHLVRLANDRDTGNLVLDVVPLATATSSQPLSTVELSRPSSPNSCAGGARWLGEMFSRGDHIYMPFVAPLQGHGTMESFSFQQVELADRAAPRVAASASLPVMSVGTTYVLAQTDDALLVGHGPPSGSDELGQPIAGGAYEIFDVSSPEEPRHVSTFQLLRPMAVGWGRFPPGGSLDQRGRWRGGSDHVLLSEGNLIVSQHGVRVPGTSDGVAFYLDRLDLSNPARPRLLAPLNIPGSPVYFNQHTGELLTLGAASTSSSQTRPERSLHLLSVSAERAELRSQTPLDGERSLHVFAVSGSDFFYTTKAASGNVRLEALRVEAGQLTQLASLELPRPHIASAVLYARGGRVFDFADHLLTVVDLRAPGAPRTWTQELPHWPCASPEVSETALYCALGQGGLQVIELDAAP